MPLFSAKPIIREQMLEFVDSGLAGEASEIHVGINGDPNVDANWLPVFPVKSKITFHGANCRTELRTLLLIEQWCKSNDKEAFLFYFHSKGATHAPGSAYRKGMADPWRNRMMQHCVTDWRKCVKDLIFNDAVGCHWLTGQGHDHSQHFFAGSFWWCRASFFRTIPSVTTRQRIKDSGIDALESRFESEVHLGNGPKLPKVKNLYSGGIGT